ncbi:MAG TPA: malto-oligosyltrehalose trehalohydrolase [Longimicrobiales bacterium]|nr:malto-oligosyltrehalose trehalohydrolase [Longimicrobiales bacterium]
MTPLTATGAPPTPWAPPAHLGARVLAGGRCSFRVWAPRCDQVRVRLHEDARTVPLERAERGYHEAIIDRVEAGARYTLLLDDGTELPDPASRAQPDGVHGASMLVSDAFPWTDGGWRGRPLEQYVIYELHVGTFTAEGTFDAVIPRLAALRELGIAAIELMPIAEFPGGRNWGYDGVFPFAAQSTYGGLAGLKRLVDAAHAAGLAVVLDVVYNHLGPEGNYLPRYGRYFTDRYRTPWGDALNFDGPDSDEVRAFFMASALQWLDECHIDALRLDAVHAILDHSAYPFLRELADTVRARAAELDRHILLIAESDLADPRVIRPPERGGLGMHGQWVDDFHHALHALLTGEQQGYYRDYGSLEHFARAWREGFVYAGEYSEFRSRRHGQPAPDVAPSQFVVFTQNHDQVGNRLAGDRLSTLVGVEALRLAAAATLLTPYVPLLFMGEEYGETRPFPYFVSHADRELVSAVREGRRDEFAAFGWESEPPDPQAEATFRSAVLAWERRDHGPHAELLALYRRLLELRRTEPLLRRAEHTEVTVHEPATGAAVLRILRAAPERALLLLLNFGVVPARAELPRGRWRTLLATADDRAAGAAGDTLTLTDAAELPGTSALLLGREGT